MTVPHYGKREPGLLTAASPGDTIYIPLAFYNDSGASIGIGNTLVVGDIEVFKNGSATQRATDSGYALLGDTGNFDNRIGFKGISISLFNTADDASFYAAGSTYWVAVDGVTVDARPVRFWCAVFEIGRNRVDVRELIGDTGAANWLKQTFAAGFSDTGIQERLGRIQSDVDTGLRVHIDDLDTGLHAHISDVDTGLHATIALLPSDTGLYGTLADYDTGTRDFVNDLVREHDTGIRQQLNLGVYDTGAMDRLAKILADTDTGLKDELATLDTGLRALISASGSGNITAIRGDTGAADVLQKFGTKLAADGEIDTGTGDGASKLAVGAPAPALDTGQINQVVWQANAARSITASSDTGVNDRLSKIQFEVDTGIRAVIQDVDTGLHATIALLPSDTGLYSTLFDFDTGLRDLVSDLKVELDTGLRDLVSDLKVELDTGLRALLALQPSDTGIYATLADYDTGMRDYVRDNVQELDTGFHDAMADLDTGLRGKFMSDTGGWPRVNIRKVNSVQVQGVGDTGTGDTWRPV